MSKTKFGVSRKEGDVQGSSILIISWVIEAPKRNYRPADGILCHTGVLRQPHKSLGDCSGQSNKKNKRVSNDPWVGLGRLRKPAKNS
ncbi:hypothetical protein PAPYR_8179 [Paratrimastix pyriformis]|uniref:Ribosomal protein L2 n=1 Tax=Paratrimastix pyriformis TaxID=342808 RepID=A0ABQ8UB59_9EUKA|nr:hypothetical protein PAPYR_8179 [Paratrimastix pyriformis]